MSLITINGISAGYDRKNIIEDISFLIDSGEIVGVLGLNGSGKSTLAKAICGILPHEGDVTVNNNKIEGLKSQQVATLISYIPQHSGIAIDISVFDVVMMGFNPRLGLFKNPNADMIAIAKNIIEKVGLLDKINANYMQLSEGQKQLVILARALVSDSRFLVMDEPESALDFTIRYQMMKHVRDWMADGNRASLVILHDTSLALNMCDRLVLIKDKKLAGMCDLRNDEIGTIEDNLRKIYGDVSLTRTISRSGRDRLIMTYESEDL